MPRGSSIRRLVFGVTALPILAFLALWQLGTVVCLFEGRFFPQRVFTATSPDNQQTIAVTKRVAFPANELVDPSIIVTVELFDSASGRVLQRQRVELLEDSDLREPTIEWTPAAARVTGFDSREERLLTFNRNG